MSHNNNDYGGRAESITLAQQYQREKGCEGEEAPLKTQGTPLATTKNTLNSVTKAAR